MSWSPALACPPAVATLVTSIGALGVATAASAPWPELFAVTTFFLGQAMLSGKHLEVSIADPACYPPCLAPVKFTGPPSVWKRSVSTPLADLLSAKFSYFAKYYGRRCGDVGLAG